MKHREFALGFAASVPLIALAWVAWLTFKPAAVFDPIVKSNGRLEMQRIEIATKFAGRVLSVPVQEGAWVKPGDLIAQMDASDLQAQLQSLQAMRQRAVHAMARAEGEARVRRIQANVAEMELSNALDLRKQVLVSDSEVKRRQAQHDGEQAGISIATAAVGEAEAARDEADAGIQRLQLAIADHALRAPVAGRIEYRVVEPSSVVAAGARVATLLDTAHVHMTIFLSAQAVGQLHLGDPARIVLDAAPNMPLPARVTFVSDEAQFTPKHVETSSEREKLSFRVRLSITEEAALAHSGLLKSGQTGVGYVHLRPSDKSWPMTLSSAQLNHH